MPAIITELVETNKTSKSSTETQEVSPNANKYSYDYPSM